MLAERIQEWLNPNEEPELKRPVLEFSMENRSLTVHFRHACAPEYLHGLRSTRCFMVFHHPDTWNTGYELPDDAGVTVRTEPDGSESMVSRFTVYADRVPTPLDAWDQGPLVNIFPLVSQTLEPLLHDPTKSDVEKQLILQAVLALRMTFDPNFQFLHTPSTQPTPVPSRRDFFANARVFFSRAT